MHAHRYYMCGGDSIVSGSSEERLVRIHCTATGEMLACTDMHPGRRNPLVYVPAGFYSRPQSTPWRVVWQQGVVCVRG